MHQKNPLEEEKNKTKTKNEEQKLQKKQKHIQETRSNKIYAHGNDQALKVLISGEKKKSLITVSEKKSLHDYGLSVIIMVSP